MERFDVNEARLADVVEAAAAGEEVVITRNGGEVVRLTATPKPKTDEPTYLSGAELVARLEDLRRQLPPEVFKMDWTDAVRRMRDED